jgi:hypothetical protein
METTTTKPAKKEWIHTWVQKLLQSMQTDENKKFIHVFLVDPILNYVLERLFPYILILCVLFVILTIMISLTLLVIFTRIPNVFDVHASSVSTISI